MFAKNGTDATTICCTIARAQTGRRRILVATGAYHGAAPWCTPRLAGVTAADRANLGYYTFNDLASVRRRGGEAGDDLAAIVVSPFKHDAGFDQELVDPAFARGLRELCDADRRRADPGRRAVRLPPAPGLKLGADRRPAGPVRVEQGHRQRPSRWRRCSARRCLGGAAASMFVTGSFWFSAAAMAAAIATIGALREEGAIEAMDRAGTRCATGILRQAAERGIEISYTGPPAMPYLTSPATATTSSASVFAAAAVRGWRLPAPAAQLVHLRGHDRGGPRRGPGRDAGGFAAVAGAAGVQISNRRRGPHMSAEESGHGQPVRRGVRYGEEAILARAGYRPELRRSLRFFSMFAIAFSIISITTGHLP